MLRVGNPLWPYNPKELLKPFLLWVYKVIAVLGPRVSICFNRLWNRIEQSESREAR